MSRVSLSQLQNANRSIQAMRAMFDQPNAAPALPAPAAFDAFTLPLMQQAALIQLTETHVKRALIARLLEDAQDKPQAEDYRALVDLGLAERREADRWHHLTRAGVEPAKILTQKLCLRFNVHMLTEGGDSGWQVRYACPCGFSTMVRRSRTAWGNAATQHAASVRTKIGIGNLVQALKPPGMTEG